MAIRTAAKKVTEVIEEKAAEVEAAVEKKVRKVTPAGRFAAAKKALNAAKAKLAKHDEKMNEHITARQELHAKTEAAREEYNAALHALVGEGVEIVHPDDKQDVDAAAVDAIDAGLTPALDESEPVTNN